MFIKCLANSSTGNCYWYLGSIALVVTAFISHNATFFLKKYFIILIFAFYLFLSFSDIDKQLLARKNWTGLIKFINLDYRRLFAEIFRYTIKLHTVGKCH